MAPWATDLPAEEAAPLRTQEQNAQQARRLCEGLAGYVELTQVLCITDAMTGVINFGDESLFVVLASAPPAFFDAVWWWNPLAHGKPTLTWRDLLKLHADATRAISKHAWLAQWRATSPGREIELHAYGRGVGVDRSDLDMFVMPLWREAKLPGRPIYSVLARRSDQAWAQLYFDREANHALVTAVSDPDNASGHWLDNVEVYFHPRCTAGDRTSRYLVIDPSGRWQIRSYKRCQP